MSQSADSGLIEIYHIEGARSFRVAWLCEEIGLPYTLIFEPGNMMESMRRIRKDYPLMPICPVVRYQGQHMVETGAILEVLSMRHGPHLRPKIDDPDYVRHAQWMHFAEATLLSRIATQRLLAIATGVDVDKLPAGYVHGDDIDKPAMVGPIGLFAFIEDYLGQQPFFGGSAFSTADIMMHYSIRSARRAVWIDHEDYANISRWKVTVEKRAAFARATAATLPNGSDRDGVPPGLVHPFSPRPSSAR